ncbi:MAG TPA: response regulator [Capsulimonadaceae bacterium]
MAKRILISDDALFMRTMLRSILEGSGYEVVDEAANGEEAVAKYDQHSPDLVMMDITMPVMDGISAVKAIKAKDPSCKIIMCTAMGQKEMVLDAIKSGAKDYIVKPFQAPRVLQSVEKLIGPA